MISKKYRVCATLCLMQAALLFSGCSNSFYQTSIELPPQETVLLETDDLQESAEQENQEIQNSELELSDKDVCLKEELSILGDSGLWGGKSKMSLAPSDGVKYDFPVVMNSQVQAYLNLFQGRLKDQYGRWLSRSSIYRELMEKELADAGLPKDLVYLSMIESGFSPTACSTAKAVGLWQFMRGTGKDYNLRVDNYVDERRDPAKSTKAAVAFLGDLYQEFGDWHLAVAAYNAGPGKIRNGLNRYKVDNFWDLADQPYLAMETKRYVPKLIAAMIIGKNPAKYGLTGISYAGPLAYDSLEVGPGLSFDALALISDSTVKEIERLNRELRKKKTPLNVTTYQVNIPSGKGAIAAKNLERLHSIVTTDYKTHKIRKGESLSAICQRYDINKTTLLKVNNLRNGKLEVGKNLRIPYQTVAYRLLPEGTSDALAAFKDSLILHRIKPGETVSKIANKYKVPPELIVSWNGLKSAHSIRAGQQLALYMGQPQVKEEQKNIEVAATRLAQSVPTIKPRMSKQIPDAASDIIGWYDVQNGDSLWTISQKFSISPKDLKKLNNLKSNLIHPGSRLKVKKV